MWNTWYAFKERGWQYGKEIWQAYKRPLYLFGVHIFASIFFPIDVPDDPKYQCGFRHCPLPPMTTAQEFFFTLTYFLNYVIVIWLFLIWVRRKYNRDGYG